MWLVIIADYGCYCGNSKLFVASYTIAGYACYYCWGLTICG